MLGPSLAHTVAKYLVLDERASQARYMVMEHLRSSDPAIRTLERFVTSNIDRQLTIDEMARADGHLAAHARAPGRAARSGRPRSASPSACGSAGRPPARDHEHSVDDVAARVGYADAAAFRRVFRRETGETPRARRARSSSAKKPGGASRAARR